MLLAEGTYEEFEGIYYRLVRNPRKEGQKVAYYDQCHTELGMDCIYTRPICGYSSKAAKEKGLHVIVSTFTGWHPLYDFADEFWGVIKWGTKENRTDLISKVHPDLIRGPWLALGATFDFAPLGLPQPSTKAIEMAKEIKQRGKYITVAPIKRNGFEARDFTEWRKLIEELKALGYIVYATCPKKHAQPDLPCEYIENMAGENNLMDLEFALHNNAEACITSNTGSVGLMLYSNCPYLFVFGGLYCWGNGWTGMRESLSKIEGYRTKLMQPEGTGPHIDQMKNALQQLKGVLK